MTLLKETIIEICLKHEGFAFGGTARDLIRGEEPNDLDLCFNGSNGIEEIKSLSPVREFKERLGDRGQAYYDQRIIFENGLQVDIKHGFCEVTDMDINLLRVFKNKIDLLYVPKHLKYFSTPMTMILGNITRKQFWPLQECPSHRQYRWKEFQDRGWKNLKEERDLMLAQPITELGI